MQIIIVYEKVENLAPELLEKLRNLGYEIVPFTQADEVDQLGTHLGKVAIFFTESKIAGRFLSENDLGNKFKIFNVLYVPKTPKITPEVKAKIDKIKLSIYYPAIEGKLIQALADFYAGKVAEEDVLEFLLPTDPENP